MCSACRRTPWSPFRHRAARSLPRGATLAEVLGVDGGRWSGDKIGIAVDRLRARAWTGSRRGPHRQVLRPDHDRQRPRFRRLRPRDPRRGVDRRHRASVEGQEGDARDHGRLEIREVPFYAGVAPARPHPCLQSARQERRRLHQRRHPRDRLRGRQPRALRHRHHQPVARPSDLRACGDRSAGAGGGARLACRRHRRGRGGQLRHEPGRPACPATPASRRPATRRRRSPSARSTTHGHGVAQRRPHSRLQLVGPDAGTTRWSSRTSLAPGHNIVAAAAKQGTIYRRVSAAAGRATPTTSA